MKKVLYVILGLVVLYLILCLVGPKNITVERNITINSDPETIKKQMTDLHFFQEKWSPWSELDPKMEVNYTGNPGEVGHGYTWKGNKDVGAGTLTITKIEGDSIVQNLHFEGMGDSRAYYTIKSEGAGSKVTWGIQMHIGFMGRAMMLFMNMDKMMGGDFEKGLGKLKAAIESMPAPTASNYEVKEVDFAERNFIGTKKHRLTMDKVNVFFGDNFHKVMEEMQKNKIELMSPPSALYYDFKNEDMSADVVACFAAPKGAKVKGLENYEFPAGKAVMLEYHGGYGDMMNAHNAIMNYIKEKNLSAVTTLEEYVTDPMMEKDSTKWITNIYYILK